MSCEHTTAFDDSRWAEPTPETDQGCTDCIAEGFDVCGVVAILDRLAGGAEAIQLASGDAPYEPLATIDDVYPDRPDRG